MRGTTTLSRARSARRSALLTASSSAEMGRRWLTPLRLSMRLSRRADRIDVPDHVRDRHVRRGQLLHVAVVRREPRDGRLVAALGDEITAALADRPERVVVDLAAGHRRDPVVQQRGQAAQQPALGLAAQAQQDQVVSREDRVHDLRHHRVLVPQHAGEQRLPACELAAQVLAHLVLHAAGAVRRVTAERT
jgi:hypothetical protein